MTATVLSFNTGIELTQLPTQKPLPTSISKAPEQIQSLYRRFGINDNEEYLYRLISRWSTDCPEPYAYGCTHDKTWSKQKNELGVHKLWNSPFPVPCKTSVKSIKGVLGKDVLQGGTDPLMFMDRKYKVSLNVIKAHKGIKLEIFTSSDLIAHDEYIEVLDKENHTINIVYTTSNDEYNRLLEPGAPSYKRRINALEKLLNLGYNAKLIYVKFDGLELTGDAKQLNLRGDHGYNEETSNYIFAEKLPYCKKSKRWDSGSFNAVRDATGIELRKYIK